MMKRVVGEGEARVAVYERDIKIQFTERTPAVYKPKLPFTAYIKITNNADGPLHIPPDSIYSTVRVYGVGHYLRQVPSSGYRSSTYSGTYPILARKVTLPDSGLFSLDLDIPEDVTSVDLMVTFQGVQNKLTLHQVQHSEGDSYLQIYLMGSVPAVTRYGHEIYGRGRVETYDMIMYRVHNLLRNNCTSPPAASADAVTLTYLALACATYGFSADGLMARLMASRNASHAANVLFWNTDPNDDFNYLGDWLPGRHVAGSADVVTAANVLQVLVHSGHVADAEHVARWLFRQRNGNGLFKTAWDTLAATEALLVYENGPGANASNVHLNGHLTSQNNSQWMARGQPSHFTASGHGEIFSQVEVKYHVRANVGDSPYEVVPVVLDESLHHFKLMVCNKWLLSKDSGVTVQQVTLPSGFAADTSSLARQSDSERLSTDSERFFMLYTNSRQGCDCGTHLSADRAVTVAHTCHLSWPCVHHQLYQARIPRHNHVPDSAVCDTCPVCCTQGL